MLARRLGMGLRPTGLFNAHIRPRTVPSSGLRLGSPAAAAFGVRHKSEIASEIGKIGDAAAETASDAAQAVAQAVPVSPDQIGYFQSVGLAQTWYWPEGFFQHIFEYVHTSVGLPWWATILAVTLSTRFLMLPIYMSSSDAAAKMARIKPELTQIMEKTKQATDQRQVQESMIARRKLMLKHEVKVLNMAKPLLGVPIFLGVFNALRGMSHVPVDGFTTQGLAWFTNLAAADPYCGLQIITATLYAATFKFFGGETGAAQVSPVMKKVFTYMPFIAVPMTMALPSSVCFYFAINSVFSIFQSNILKSKFVRQKLGLAPMVTPEEQAEINKRLGVVASESNDSIMAALRKKYDDAKEQAERKVEQQEARKAAELAAKREAELGYVQVMSKKSRKQKQAKQASS